MRIGIVITVFTPNAECGGPVNVAAQHAEELAGRGHDVTVFTSDLVAFSPRTRLGTLESRHGRLTIRYFASRTPVARYPAVVADVAGGIRSERANLDIVHIHFAREYIPITAARAAQRLGLPTVLQPHGMLSNRAGARSAVDWLWARSALRRAALVLALQDHERAELQRLAPGADVRILPNGIPSRPAHGLNGHRNGSPPLVLFLARLHPRKRVTTFVDMAAALRDAGVNARYAVVGHDAGDRAEAERRVGELGLSDAFVFAGGVAADGVEQWYDDADVYVLPAVDEPFPLTVLEALRAGVPTVVTDGCFIAAELERAQAAIVASPTAGSLAGAVTSILRDEALARRLGANGQAAVERQFRLGAVADRLLDLYEEIAR